MIARILVAQDRTRQFIFFSDSIKFEKIQYECLRCIHKFVNNTEGMKTFFSYDAGHVIVARCLDYKKPQNMILALQVSAAAVFVLFIYSGKLKTFWS